VPYGEVPAYVKAFDVCVNPYVLDGVAEHCSPLKLYEYVATGKPVVSVDMPEAHTFDGLISIARSPDEFIGMVENAVAHDDGLAKARQVAAQTHTWSMRFERVVAILAEVLGEKAD
jgi:glycosyltransferase involved in cell wall biosynthesis